MTILSLTFHLENNKQQKLQVNLNFLKVFEEMFDKKNQPALQILRKWFTALKQFYLRSIWGTTKVQGKLKRIV